MVFDDAEKLSITVCFMKIKLFEVREIHFIWGLSKKKNVTI